MIRKLLIGLGLLLMSAPAQAGVGKAAQEAAEFVLKKFGMTAVREGGEAFAGRIASAVARHGDDVIAAVRKVGPKALSLADDAGENAPRLLRMLAAHGDDAARVFARPQALTLLSRYGDDVAEVLIKHNGIAEPLLASLGAPALKAMGALGPQAGRRLAMFSTDGTLSALGRTPELLGVIGKHGDKAMEFVWRHKAVLAGTAALTAFLVNPEPYLDGTNQLIETVGETAVKPTVVAVGNVAQEATGFVRHTLTIIAVVGGVAVVWCIKNGVLARPGVQAAAGAIGKRVIAAMSPKPKP
jgi:hypothetical protein